MMEYDDVFNDADFELEKHTRLPELELLLRSAIENAELVNEIAAINPHHPKLKKLVNGINNNLRALRELDDRVLRHFLDQWNWWVQTKDCNHTQRTFFFDEIYPEYFGKGKDN